MSERGSEQAGGPPSMESCNLSISVVGLDYLVSSHEDSLFWVGSKQNISF